MVNGVIQMTEITITLTEAQLKGLEYAAVSPQEWCENAILNRATVSIDDIVQRYTARALDEGVSIPATRDEIVTDAFARGWVRTAAEVEADAEAERAERA